MKNTLLKVWGIVLTLAIIAGLLMAIVPVTAADNSWTTLNKPAVTVTTNANLYTIAADGKTMYLYDNNGTPANSKLYKSIDAGLTWSATGMDADGTLFGAKPITKLAVNETNANNLIATNGSAVYTSADGGRSWNMETPTFPIAAITSVDITTNSSGVCLLVGYGTDLALSVNNRWYGTAAGYVGLGKSLDRANWLLLGVSKTLAASFSPTFANDSAIVVVTQNAACLTVATYIFATGAQWNGDVAITPTTGFSVLPADASGQIPAFATATGASIAFPSDYSWASSSLNKIFVSIYDATSSVIYRINGKTAATATSRASYTAMTLIGVDVVSLAYKGNLATGTLAAGASNDPAVYTISGVATTTTFNWISSTQNPRGGTVPNTMVAFSPISNTLYAGTASTGLFGSAFSSSTDYNSFAGISFVSVTALANVSLPAGGLTGVGALTQWQKLYDSGATDYMLFKSVDSGATWSLVYENGATGFSTFLSPAFATDKTVYLVQNAPKANKLVKSYDAGATWGSVTVAGNYAISGFSPIDGSNYWFGTTTGEGIRSNTNATFAYLDGGTPFILINLPGCFLVWEFGGQVFVSTDGGVTFVSLDTVSQIANGFNTAFTFGFDGKNWTVYMIAGPAGSQSIKSFTVGVSTIWKTYATIPAGLMKSSGTIASLAMVPGGAWYFGVPGNTTAEVWRSTDLLTFEAIDSPGSAVISAPSLTVAATATGTVNIFAEVAGAVVAPLYANKFVQYTDSRLAGPTVSSPAAGNLQTNTVNGSTMVDFMWNAVPNATGYSLEIAYDAAFSNMAAAAPYAVAGTSKSQISLTPGRDYYWRVRVAVGSPLQSYYSAATKFSTAVVSSTSQGLDQAGRMYPDQGAVITGTNLTFTWGSVASADSYEFKLLKDGVEVVSKTGLTTTVYSATGLVAGAQYTWQVRAVAGGVAGNWVTSAFTTLVPPATVPAPTTSAAPPVTPIITVNVPPVSVPQATVNVTVPASEGSTSTPAWAWIVIAIGAVLVIAVIVLIVRTRKV